jgi:hypothetical protein
MADQDISRRYREIAREEPGARLDDAILAASRRAVHRGSARRWAVPVSIAAVLVLSFGLTLEMKREQPDVETAIPIRAAPPAPATIPEAQPVAPAAKDLAAPVAPASPESPAPPPPAKVTAPRRQAPASETREARPEPRAFEEDKPAAQKLKQRMEAAPEVNAPASEAARATPEQPASSAGAIAPQRAITPSLPATTTPAATTPPPPAPASAAAPAAPAAPAASTLQMNAAPAMRAKSASDAMQRAAPLEKEVTTPEMQELERIAQLRAQGRDAEADRAIDEFRRRHPDYRIPDAMWERVRPR